MMGGTSLEAVELENTKTHERRNGGDPGGLYPSIGAKPCTGGCRPRIERDEKGFRQTGQAIAGAPPGRHDPPPGPLETRASRESSPRGRPLRARCES